MQLYPKVKGSNPFFIRNPQSDGLCYLVRSVYLRLNRVFTPLIIENAITKNKKKKITSSVKLMLPMMILYNKNI